MYKNLLPDIVVKVNFRVSHEIVGVVGIAGEGIVAT